MASKAPKEGSKKNLGCMKVCAVIILAFIVFPAIFGYLFKGNPSHYPTHTPYVHDYIVTYEFRDMNATLSNYKDISYMKFRSPPGNYSIQFNMYTHEWDSTELLYINNETAIYQTTHHIEANNTYTIEIQVPNYVPCPVISFQRPAYIYGQIVSIILTNADTGQMDYWVDRG
jgi:hypothetical protein